MARRIHITGASGSGCTTLGRALAERLFGEEALAPGGRMHETHTKFMAWAAGYDTGDLSMRSRARHEQWLRGIPCPVVRLEGDGTVDEHAAEVMRHIEVPERGGVS